MLINLTKLFLLNKNRKYDLIGIAKLHGTSQLQKDELQSVENKDVNKINDTLGKYTLEQEKEILKIVNNYNLNELLVYDISKSRANKLLTWRTHNGLLKNLRDIFLIDSFSLKIADKFYRSLLQESKRKELDLGKTSKSRTTLYIAPSLEAEQREIIKSCLSLRIGVNSITWARLDVPCQDVNASCLLTHWEHYEISEKKLHLNELIQRCLYVNDLIPLADCYLFESPQMVKASNNSGSVEQQNINIQKAQVTAIMGYALASRNEMKSLPKFKSNKKTKHLPNVFYLRRLLTARLFNNLVGTERISSEQTILNMMRTYYNTEEMNNTLNSEDYQPHPEGVQKLEVEELNFTGRVQFPLELRQMFSKSPPYYREFLGQTLLLNLAFIRLVLLQDEESIALVTRGNKRKNSLSA